MRESSSCITSRVCASRAPNGSSMRTMDGLLASARAIATRCFIPPESCTGNFVAMKQRVARSEEHTSELQSRLHLVCRLLLEKKKNNYLNTHIAFRTDVL